jgi:hypothetical protein
MRAPPSFAPAVRAVGLAMIVISLVGRIGIGRGADATSAMFTASPGILRSQSGAQHGAARTARRRASSKARSDRQCMVDLRHPPRSVTGEPLPVPSDRPPPIVHAGRLNEKAISLPKPTFPDTGSAADTIGTVNVCVLVDAEGRVVGAWAISGPVLLRASAVQAALGARFPPSRLDGVPLKFSGMLVYRFGAPGSTRAARVKQLRSSEVIENVDLDGGSPPTAPIGPVSSAPPVAPKYALPAKRVGQAALVAR